MVVKRSKLKSVKGGNVNGKNQFGKIKILDSLNIINNSLNNIATNLLGLDGKDLFPHFFKNKNTLNYKGNVPNIKYFNISNLNLVFKGRFSFRNFQHIE